MDIFLEASCGDLVTGLNRKLHRNDPRRDLSGLRDAIVGELKKLVGDVEGQRKAPEELTSQEVLMIKEYLVNEMKGKFPALVKDFRENPDGSPRLYLSYVFKGGANYVNQRLYFNTPRRTIDQVTPIMKTILLSLADDLDGVMAEVLAPTESLEPRTAETELPRWRTAVEKLFPVDEEMLAIDSPMTREAFVKGLELDALKQSTELLKRFPAEKDLLKARKIIDFVVLQTEALIKEIHGQDHLRDVMVPCRDFVRAVVGIIDVHDIDAFTVRLEVRLEGLRTVVMRQISL